MNDLNENELAQVSGAAKTMRSKGPMEMQEAVNKINLKYSNAFSRHHLEKEFGLILNDLQNAAKPFDAAIRHCEEFSVSDSNNYKLYFRLWDELILLRAQYQEN